MVTIDLSGNTALITGGTQGIGKAAALELARAGAKVFVTCKWGSVDEAELKREFADSAATEPNIVQADVSVDDDTDRLLEAISVSADGVDIFVSNVGFAPLVKSLDDYVKRSFFKTVEYSSWPIIEYTRKMKQRFGRYPKRIVAVSSDGPDHYYRGYDYVSAAKALLEHFAKYLAVHLQHEGSTVNVLRFGTVKTPSFDAIFGNEFFEYAKEAGLDVRLLLSSEECGRAILALASGLLDAMNGQIVTVDYGLPFQDNLMMRFLDWKEHKTTSNQGERKA
jgi:NAD(P)-dependent dehydrogenase (short-subunit alcohol dehydrogenase family)